MTDQPETFTLLIEFKPPGGDAIFSDLEVPNCTSLMFTMFQTRLTFTDINWSVGCPDVQTDSLVIKLGCDYPTGTALWDESHSCDWQAGMANVREVIKQPKLIRITSYLKDTLQAVELDCSDSTLSAFDIFCEAQGVEVHNRDDGIQETMACTQAKAFELFTAFIKHRAEMLVAPSGNTHEPVNKDGWITDPAEPPARTKVVWVTIKEGGHVFVRRGRQGSGFDESHTWAALNGSEGVWWNITAQQEVIAWKPITKPEPFQK